MSRANMPTKYKPGDTVYFLEQGHIVQQLQVVKYSGGFYTVRYMGRPWDRPSGFKIRESRLYATREEAEKTIPPKPSSVPWWYPD